MLTESHKNTEGKNNTINQLDLIDTYSTHHPQTEYTFKNKKKKGSKTKKKVQGTFIK